MTLVIPTYAQTVVGPAQGQWTYADWEQLPDDGNRYEVIDGVLYMSTAPSFFHQWIVQRLDRFVGIPAEEQRLAFPAVARVGVTMPGCDPVQPDFVIVLAARASIIRERRIMGVPDLIVEVISPGSAVFDEGLKRATYARTGVPEYAVIDPGPRKLRLSTLKSPGLYSEAQTFGEKDTVTFACLPTISLVVGDLFSGAPDMTL